MGELLKMFVNKKLRKARKTFLCSACGHKIKKGQMRFDTSGIDENSNWFRWTMHKECDWISQQYFSIEDSFDTDIVLADYLANHFGWKIWLKLCRQHRM